MNAQEAWGAEAAETNSRTMAEGIACACNSIRVSTGLKPMEYRWVRKMVDVETTHPAPLWRRVVAKIALAIVRPIYWLFERHLCRAWDWIVEAVYKMNHAAHSFGMVTKTERVERDVYEPFKEAE